MPTQYQNLSNDKPVPTTLVFPYHLNIRHVKCLFQYYSARHLRFYAWVTGFTFSAAISKSLELKRNSICTSLKSPKQFWKNAAIKIGKASSTVCQNWFQWKSPFFIWTSFDTLWMKLFQFWLLRFFRIALGFLKRYVTPFLLKQLRNGNRKREPGNPGVNSQTHMTVALFQISENWNQR